MSDVVSDVWRQGQASQCLIAPDGAEPVLETRRKDPRGLFVDFAFLTLHGENGVWSVGSAALYGNWQRKTDGQPGSRNGSILLSGPLAVEDGAPQWLVARAGKLTAALTRAFKEAEL